MIVFLLLGESIYFITILDGQVAGLDENKAKLAQLLKLELG
jgi:hypothetical protein